MRRQSAPEVVQKSEPFSGRLPPTHGEVTTEAGDGIRVIFRDVNTRAHVCGTLAPVKYQC